MRNLCFALLFALLASCASTDFGPQAEYRTIITDRYELVVRKDGRIDVKFNAGAPIFDNVVPLVQFADDERPRPIDTTARKTNRIEVNTRLGQGQGMLFATRHGEWTVQAYPTKPFLTVQVAYVNASKHPVRIAKLVPWSVGVPRKGALHLGPGSEQTRILENGRLFKTFSDYPEVLRDESESQWNLAAHNPASGRSLVAGFLTNTRAYTTVRMARGQNAASTGFGVFAAECVYDPPVELQPGERLDSEWFYVSLAEQDVLEGLRRFGKAMAVMNGVRDRRPFMPHGWDSWSTQHVKEINEGIVLENLAAMDRELKRYGWNHFAIDAGWQRGPGDWEADPEKFPHGMKWMADQIHARGMTAGLWVDPFTVPKDSALAEAHPEWMAKPHALGRTVMGGDDFILDVTAPGAYEYVRGLARKIGTEWGFDGLIEADFVYHLLLAEAYHAPNTTHIEALHLGMRALREGLGPGKFLMGVTVHPVNGIHAQGIRVGRDCAPVWDAGGLDGPWGAVQTLTNAIRRFYLTPHLYVPDQDCAFFGHKGSRKRWHAEDAPPLSWEQSVAWLTGAALTGGVIKVGEPFAEMAPREFDVLRKLLPSPERPAVPVDLFQQDPPRIWSLPLRTGAGSWHILGLFNWDAAEAKAIHVSFADLGLAKGHYYTVFDFWREEYRGRASDSLDVRVEPGSVRLLGLRPCSKRPMLIASNRHYTQGASDHTALAWDSTEKVLEGRFEGIAQTDYRLWVLVPEGYEAGEATVSSGPCQSDVAGHALRLGFRCTEAGPVVWRVAFKQAKKTAPAGPVIHVPVSRRPRT